MANDVKIRFKSHLPGGGFNSSGDPKQGKTRVVGEIDVTSYVHGENLSAIDIGLTAIDSISLRIADETGSAGAQTNREVLYVKSVAQFYVNTVSQAGVKLGATGAGTETIEFDALGDSAEDVELT